jgi:predicted RNase H-like HicB family nuclease
VEIPVLLEPLPDGGFRAKSGEPLDLAANGATPETALSNLRTLIDTRIAAGTRLTAIEIPDAEMGRHRGAGIYEDEPLFDLWLAEIEAYRQEIEDDPNSL